MAVRLSFPFSRWLMWYCYFSVSAIVMYIAGILLVGIPLVSLVWAIFSQIFKWQPMNSGLKWTLVILWIVSAACFGICFAVQGATFPELGIFNF
ncbi:hypothetical protein BACUNI_02992 [Bacteroides uniformis ATCC 8492]|uniref:PspC-related transmembrane region domain-containing protein n=2 Tax=Bacteroides uniformis TaxID=820 RepID=A0ABC9NB04_BACUC|nr:hypothetical protein BACUNI_02992 [Bacteroides uniformis ATCC 8492]